MGRTRDFVQSIVSAFWVMLGLIELSGGSPKHYPLWKPGYWAAGLLLLLPVQSWVGTPWWPRFAERLPRLSFRAGLRLASAVFVVVFTWGLIRRFESFQANAFDLSFMTQSLWNTLHGGGFLHITLIHDTSYLSYHFAPALALLSPLFLLPARPEWALFAAHALLLASGAWFLVRLASKGGLEERLALLLALLFLLYQPMWLSCFFDFREDVFYIPAIFALLLLMDDKTRGPLFWAPCFLRSRSRKTRRS